MSDQIIAFQGVVGAYSYLACKNVFPEMAPLPCHTFIEAMEKVHEGKANLAMIPLENSTAGRVEEIYRLIPETDLYIIGEHFQPVNHCLIGLKTATLETLTHVSSHPQALAQCFHNIEKLGLEQKEDVDTALSVQKVKEKNDPTYAAIASKLAAETYDLQVLKENFQDRDGNTTRFLILSRNNKCPAYSPDKSYITSLIFKVRNIPAALYKALGGFATNGVNLVKLESYSAGNNFMCSQFHVDIEAHPAVRAMELALQELSFFADEVRTLGTFEAHPYRLNH